MNGFFSVNRIRSEVRSGYQIEWRNIMRKKFLSVLGMTVILSMYATTAFAACPRGGCNFVDADGDGICDNSGSMCIYTDADGDGICDNCGSYHWCGMAGIGCGGNFVDEDSDGICDNYVAGQCRGNGRGRYGCGFRGGRNR